MPKFPPMDEEYHPSSSEEDESDCEPRRPYKTNNNILSHQDSAILEHHHLGDDTDLEAGTVISIGDTLELHDGSFLMTTELQRFKNDCAVKFFGYLFKPIGNFKDYLPAEFGDSELVWVCEAAEHDSKPESYWRCASSKDVLRIGLIIFTNSGHALEAFPKSQATRKFTIARPICQWKFVTEISKPHDRRKEKSFGSIRKEVQKEPKAFTALSDQDLSVLRTIAADLSHCQRQLDSGVPKASSENAPGQGKRHGHAFGRNLGTGKDARESLVLAPNTNSNRIAKSTGSPAIRRSSRHLGTNLTRPLRNLSAQETVSEQVIEQRTYTFADAFCGAGGMSIGAGAAGLRIEWAFDGNGEAVDIYSLNHGKDVCEQISAQNFLEIGNAFGIPKVDVLHLSPPCKGFSLAVRGSSKNKEENNECMKYVAEIVRLVEPRVVTLEEVPQILCKYPGYFTAMVHALTSIGYNVRWRVIKCVGFGVPQKRRRLFMIASCRGEPLPDFPKPTHAHPACCNELRLQPWNSFGGAIDHLEDSAPNHLVQNPRMDRLPESLGRPHPPDWPYCDTITTGEKWPNHYSGRYLCTVREAACLQGFPADYEFCGKLPATKEQVANAVPPPVAKAILEEIKRSLMRTDASKSS